MTNNGPNSDANHSSAYNRMLERVKDFIEEAGDEFGPKIQYAINSAKETATELGELTREEAEKIGDYIKRDLHDAAEYMANEGKDLSDWFKFDVEQVEDRLIDVLSHVVDTTKIELQALAEQAEQENIWNTGEITSPGTLICTNCGEKLVFHETREIPPCPQCQANMFHRRETKRSDL